MDSQVERKVRKLTSDWRCLPPVDVVASHAALPIAADEGVDGLYLAGKVFVVDRGDTERAIRVLGHELAHHGTRAAMGWPAWRSFMSSVMQGQRAGDEALTRVREHVRSAYAGDELTMIREADEVVAHVAEQRVNPETGLFEVPAPWRARLVAAWRHFARERLFLPVSATSMEIDGVLLHLEDRLRRGRPLWDALGWCYAGLMSTKPMGPKNPARTLRESQKMVDGATRSETFPARLVLTLICAACAVLGLAFFAGGAAGLFSLAGTVFR